MPKNAAARRDCVPVSNKPVLYKFTNAGWEDTSWIGGDMTYQTLKYGFRIRSRIGIVIENLAIHGRDEADAERKLRQMYPHCEVLECRTVNAPRASGSEAISFEEVLALVAK